MTTAGITGPVSIVRHGDVALDALFVTPLDHATGAVQVAVVLTNHRDVPLDVTVHLTVEAEHAALDVTVPPGSGRVDLVTDLAHLGRWEPVHSPHGAPDVHELHGVVVAGGRVTDRRTTRFGLRTARVVTAADGHARHLEVNGRPTFVKAVNYIPWQHFAEVGRAFYDRDMRMIAAAHGNSVGVHAHVQSPHAYDAADAAGVLVFQDFPLQWFYDSGTETNPGFVEEAQRQIAEMAYLLHSHPSVVYYACHNEPRRQFIPTPEADDTPERDLGERHLDAALHRTLSSVDDSRHVHEASGIGDDVHSYCGSLMGGSLYDVGSMPSWFVSEYGFWTVGPQGDRFGDTGWPPDVEQMRQWVSRLSFIGSTVGYAGLPSRYESLAAWTEATQTYGAALAKHQTEWFRIHRGAPFMGYRWHFWADWWGYAGGGLVDVDRVEKGTYAAFRDASRPVLVTGRVDASIVEPGTVTVPVFCVNDTTVPWRGEVAWEVRDATSAVIAPDPAGFRIGIAPPDTSAGIAVPRVVGGVLDAGALTVDGPAEASTRVGEIAVPLAAGTARTVMFQWGGETNFVHLHCPTPDEEHPPGLHDVVW
jgi:beta-mannosidase